MAKLLASMFILALAAFAAPQQGPSREVQHASVCDILSSPDDYRDAPLTLNVIVVPDYFHGPTIRTPGCFRTMALGGAPNTPDCQRLSSLLGLPGYEPAGDVFARVDGHIVIREGSLPVFRLSGCSNARVGSSPLTE
ncbi:MAG: hypothetical protein EON58_12770 [Alphaproteobacteria bacterium]|nr:MAG: hypothetical protein EON58_12770 [Alphaproteobacteria bacterium]